MSDIIHADYLVVGAGAMGMAFTDVLLNETDATVALVDRRHQPGGHWNVAYPYVRLHQPSAFYGVNSRKLGNDTIDQQGWNEGLYELATNSEVCAYFDAVLNQQFLPSGRVQYLPMSEYEDGNVRSLVSGDRRAVDAKKIVDATYMNVSVPSMRPPPFPVSDEVACVPPNALPAVQGEYGHFTVIGAGKTGMDACLWLLSHGVDAGCIRWIVPRDSWILDRAMIQPGAELARGFANQAEAIAESDSIEDMFLRLEACGQLLRIDERSWPSMYRCATVTKKEIAALQTVTDVVRMGHVQRIDDRTLVLDEGTVEFAGDTLFVDCTADGLARKPPRPVFADDTITLQSVRTCQQVFSAAFIAHVEASYDGDTLKNELCTPVPHPDSAEDFIRTGLLNALNGARWSQDAELTAWLADARLDGFSGAVAATTDEAVVSKAMQFAMSSTQKLAEYVAQIDGGS